MFLEAYLKLYKRPNQNLTEEARSNINTDPASEAPIEDEDADGEIMPKNKHKKQSVKILMESMLHDMRVYRGEE